MAIEYKFRGFSAKNDRRDRRIPVDLPAIVDDEDVTVKDIAFGGMRFVAELDADLELGDQVDISINLGRGKKLHVEGLIVWFDGVDQFGVTFTGLTPAAFAAIEALQTHLGQRGKGADHSGVSTSSFEA